MKDKISLGIVVLVSFILGGLAMFYFNKQNANTSVVKTETGEMVCKSCNSTVIVEDGSLSAAVEKIADATVMIKNFKNTKTNGSGSGFVYKEDNKYQYIMTNHHVVKDGTKYTVISSNDTEMDATLLGSDEYLDLAVLRVDKNNNLKVASINKKNEMKVGDQVITIGCPVDYEYRGTVTNGIISGLNRKVTVSVSGSADDWIMEVIQTNASVNPGNSGGPLCNAKGEVIGVISMKLVDSSIEGMGFAIPIDYAMSHVDTLESGKAIERPVLGISMLNVSDTWTLYKQGITIDDEVESGVVVVEVTKDTPASKSDLKKGDVITKFNDIEVENYAYLKYLLYKYNPGDKVKITYYRDGKFKTTEITLTKAEK